MTGHRSLEYRIQLQRRVLQQQKGVVDRSQETMSRFRAVSVPVEAAVVELRALPFSGTPCPDVGMGPQGMEAAVEAGAGAAEESNWHVAKMNGKKESAVQKKRCLIFGGWVVFFFFQRPVARFQQGDDRSIENATPPACSLLLLATHLIHLVFWFDGRSRAHASIA